jgi:nitric oxide synthase-interacting protein
MPRHSKKAGVMGSEGLTYHERRALGFGTVKERLGADSMGNFYDCRLTLAPASDPVSTPHGVIYSKEAIYENLLSQKRANKKKMAAWEAQKQASNKHMEEEAAIEREARLIAFDRQVNYGASEIAASRLKQSITQEAAEHLRGSHLNAVTSASIKGRDKQMKDVKSFWIPGKTDTSVAKAERPDMNTYCPATGKVMKLKHLRPVHFWPAPEGGPHGYMDPLTKDLLTNASRLVSIQPCGDVVLWDTWKKIILPEGMYNGVEVNAESIIELQKGGTGFAAHDEGLQASKNFLLGAGSGLADRRGQVAAAGSKFGLVFNN